MFLQAVFLGLCWFSCTSSIPINEDPPGFVVRLKPEPLKFASDIGVMYFPSYHISRSLNGMNHTESCIFGSCSLQYFYVKNYIPPKSNVTFISGKGLGWTLLEAEFNFCFYFEMKDTEADKAAYVRGYACVRLSGVSLDAVLELEKGTDGRLNISLTKCLVDVRVINSNVSITAMSGNSSKFQGLFDGNKTELHDYLHNRLNASVSTVMYNMADSVARAIPDGLKGMNKQLAFYAGFILNDTLVREPIIQSDCIEVAFRANFHMVGDEVESSISPPNLHLPPLNSSMVGIYMSDHVLNTLLNIVYKKGWISVNITKNIRLPSAYRYYGNLFDTSCDDPFCFKTIFPNISEKYPNSSVKFVFRATSRPSVNFSSKAVSSQGDFELSILIREEDGSEVTVAKLPMFVSKSAGMYFLMFIDRVVSVITATKITVKDKGSPKEFASYAPLLESFLQTMTDSLAVPWCNVFGAIGHPMFLSYYGIRLVNTDLGFGTGDFHFSSDFENYSTPPIVSDSYRYFDVLLRVWA